MDANLWNAIQNKEILSPEQYRQWVDLANASAPHKGRFASDVGAVVDPQGNFYYSSFDPVTIPISDQLKNVTGIPTGLFGDVAYPYQFDTNPIGYKPIYSEKGSNFLNWSAANGSDSLFEKLVPLGIMAMAGSAMLPEAVGAGTAESTSALAADQIGAMNAGGNMDFFDTLDTLLQGGYSDADAWTMAEQLTGGADIGSQVASFAGGEAAGTSLFSQAASLAKQLGITPANAVSAILKGGGGLLSGNAAKSAAQTSADAQLQAARIAADAAKFRPVGISNFAGKSYFNFDPTTGYLSSAGYTLSPEMKALQEKLMGSTSGLLTQFTGAKDATAPMGTAAQRAMTLGNQYLAADPQAQAKMFMDQQQALLAGSREQGLAALQNKLAQQGRLGLATGGTSTGMLATNPEMAAYQNAIQQQNLQLAANATQGGMDYAKFGAGMVGTGSDLLKGMYGTQTAAYNPFQTALGGATDIEKLGQNALQAGIDLGSTTTAANAKAGGLLGQGMANAAATMQPANAYSPWGALLSGAGQQMQGYRFDPFTGKAL